MSTLDGPLSTTRYFGILFGQHPDNMETQLIDFINTNAGSIPPVSTNNLYNLLYRNRLFFFKLGTKTTVVHLCGRTEWAPRMKLPLNLYKNRYQTYYFRVVIPQDIRHYFKNNNIEIRRSLHTKDRTYALHRAQILSLRARIIFEYLQMSKDPLDLIKNIDPKSVTNWTATGLRITTDGTETTVSADSFFADPNNPDEEALIKALFNHGEQNPSPTSSPPIPETAIDSSPISNSSTLFSEIWEAYSHEKHRLGDWKSDDPKEYRPIVNLFTELFGDIPLSSITDDMIMTYREAVLTIPDRRNIRPKYREHSIQELLKMEIPKEHLLANNTIKKYYLRLSEIFQWAKRTKKMLRNPASELTETVSSSNKPARKAFTKDELNIIFGPTGSAHRRVIHPHHRWGILVGMFTGARIEEICQLEVADIQYVQSDDHNQILDKDDPSAILGFLFHVEENTNKKVAVERSEKSIKNESSNRFTPMHPMLVELGFLEYVDAVKRKKWKKLFQYVSPVKGKYSHELGKWFAVHLERCGVKTDAKTFHSFRYTFISRLKGLGIAEGLASAIAGHSSSGDTTSYKHYGGPVDPLTMRKAIEQFDYAPSLSILRDFNLPRNSEHARSLGIRAN